MADIHQLIAGATQTRQEILAYLKTFSYEQGRFHPGADGWSIAQHAEHMVLVEQACLRAVWSAAEALRRGQRRWTVDPKHRGRSVEELIAESPNTRPAAPEPLVPRGSGPLSFWSAALQANQTLVESLSDALDGLDLTEIVTPHPLYGPWDALQWLEFLRVHLAAHRDQIEEVAQAADFPR